MVASIHHINSPPRSAQHAKLYDFLAARSTKSTNQLMAPHKLPLERSRPPRRSLPQPPLKFPPTLRPHFLLIINTIHQIINPLMLLDRPLCDRKPVLLMQPGEHIPRHRFQVLFFVIELVLRDGDVTGCWLPMLIA